MKIKEVLKIKIKKVIICLIVVCVLGGMADTLTYALPIIKQTNLIEVGNLDTNLNANVSIIQNRITTPMLLRFDPVTKISEVSYTSESEYYSEDIQRAGEFFLSDDSIPLESDLKEYIVELSNQYDIELNLILAIIEKESVFDSNAISASDDYGLMQVNKINHKWIQEKLHLNDILNPYHNVAAGVYILRSHIDAIGNEDDIHKIAMAYNMGLGGAQKCWKQGVYNTEYSKDIYELYQKYQEKYSGIKVKN